MRQHRLANNVADGIDMRHVGAHFLIDVDEVALGYHDVGLVKGDADAVHAAANGDQYQVIDLRFPRRPFALKADFDSRFGRLGPDGLIRQCVPSLPSAGPASAIGIQKLRRPDSDRIRVIGATRRRVAGAKPNNESSPDSHFGPDVDCPAQCAHNVTYDRKPEPTASARGLGRKKRIEDMLEHPGRNPGSVISNQQSYIDARAQGPMRCGLCEGHRDLVENHREYALMLHRSHSVGAQIHNDLVELGRISQHVRVSGPQRRLELYAFG